MNLQEALNHKEMNQLVDLFKKQDWSNKKFYSSWLAQTYYYTSYSTRMLAFAAGWSEKTNKTYFKRSVVHISEEQGHELIALNDLKVLGESIENYPELGITRAMWESQFVKIQKDPVMLLGYILALETLAVKTNEFHGMLKQHYNEDALKFVKTHADDDPDHVEEALEQIQACTPEQQSQIKIGYEHTLQLYRLMIQEIATHLH
ncbi:MAG: iron-containing redox enzyme family protein [Pseudobdellovibrio sp.]